MIIFGLFDSPRVGMRGRGGGGGGGGGGGLKT